MQDSQESANGAEINATLILRAYLTSQRAGNASIAGVQQ